MDHLTQGYLIHIGGNIPTTTYRLDEIIQSSVEFVARKLGWIAKRSPMYRTPAYPAGSGPDFLNGAMVVVSDLKPEDFLSGLHEIEAELGRKRDKRWGARTVDLDLIAAGDLVTPSVAKWRQWYELPLDRQMHESPDELILPHPRMQDRAFVLIPLLDVAPDWVHPVLGQSVGELCAALPAEDRQSVVLQQDPSCQ